jgi:hypothetical protein
MTRAVRAAVLSAVFVAAVMAACAAEMTPVTPRGHEGIEPPTATSGPGDSPVILSLNDLFKITRASLPVSNRCGYL